jgi:FimV-like protein
MSFSSLESGNMSWTRKPAFLFLSLTFILVFLMNSCANLRDVRDPAEIAEDPATVFEDPFEESADAYDRMSAAILLGDPESAIQAYEDARLANPDEPETLVLLANLYIAAGDTDGARSLLDEIIAGADGQALVDARLALSLIARIDGNDEEELAQLSAVLDEQPDNPRANAALGEILLEREEYDEAEERFLKALESEPDDYFALQGLGNAYLRNGKSQAAIQVFSGAIEAEPDYSYTYTDRAKAYNEQGLYDQALEDMDRAISLDDENGWHYLDRGRMRARRGLFREAEADFTLAVERTPDNFLAYAYRAQVRDTWASTTALRRIITRSWTPARIITLHTPSWEHSSISEGIIGRRTDCSPTPSMPSPTSRRTCSSPLRPCLPTIRLRAAASWRAT